MSVVADRIKERKKEKKMFYPKCSNCRRDIMDFSYYVGDDRVCKMCWSKSSYPRRF